MFTPSLCIILVIFAFIVTFFIIVYRQEMKAIKKRYQAEIEELRKAREARHQDEMDREERYKQEQLIEEERQKELAVFAAKLQKERELCAATPGLNLLDVIIANKWHHHPEWSAVSEALTFADYCQYWQTKMENRHWTGCIPIREISFRHSFDECMKWLEIIGRQAFSDEAIISIADRAPNALQRYKTIKELAPRSIDKRMAKELWEQLQEQFNVTSDGDEAYAIKDASLFLDFRSHPYYALEWEKTTHTNYQEAMERIVKRKLRQVIDDSSDPAVIAEALHDFVRCYEGHWYERMEQLRDESIDRFLACCQTPADVDQLKIGYSRKIQWLSDFYAKAIKACNSDQELEKLRSEIAESWKGQFDDMIVNRRVELKLAAAAS